MLNRHNRGPRCGLLKKHKGAAVGLDISKAYTHCMSQITHIPVFSAFDVMVPCDLNADVDPYSFYWVYVWAVDTTLFPESLSFVPGKTVTFARSRGIEVQTHGVITRTD